MLSKKTIYGLKAMIMLAKRQANSPVLITEIAKQGNIPKKFLEAILLELKNNGFLNSKKGKGGGYVLTKMPQDISVGDIVRTLEGRLPEVFFEEESKEMNEIQLLLKKFRDVAWEILEKTSLADIIEQARCRQNALNFVI